MVALTPAQKRRRARQGLPARPPKYNGNKRQIYMIDFHWDQLKSEAERRHVSRSRLVVLAIEQLLGIEWTPPTQGELPE